MEVGGKLGEPGHLTVGALVALYWVVDLSVVFGIFGDASNAPVHRPRDEVRLPSVPEISPEPCEYEC